MVSLLAALPEAVRSQPWLTWLAVALCRQRARQTWLIEVRTRYLADPEDDSGEVPGLPGWSYNFHGRGLCLEGPGREILDVDFYADEGATIDPYFFASRLLQLDPRPFPEACLVALLADADMIVAGLDALRATGAIGHPESDHVFRLSPELEALHAEVAAIDLAQPGVQQAFLAELGDPAACRAELADWGRSLLLDRSRAHRFVGQVLPLLPVDEAQKIGMDLLDGPIDSTTAATITVAERLGLEVGAAVVDLLHRFEASRHHPYPAHAAATYLLRHGKAAEAALELIERFAAIEVVHGYRGNPYLEELAAALLEFAPARALPVVRRALRSSTPVVLQRMAVLLAGIGLPWCHRELAAALGEVAEREQRSLAAALAVMDSELARRHAAKHRPEDPRPDGRPGFSPEEVHAANLAALVGYQRDALAGLAARLRITTAGL
jgi:hypothetical protein